MKAFVFALTLIASCSALAASQLPSDSLWQLPDTFIDQDGRAFTLDSRRGHPQLVAMFYSSCTNVCPLMINTALAVDKALTPQERAKLRVLMISFDTLNDTPEALRSLANERNLDHTRWTLSRGDEEGVRAMAALLGVRYRRLEDGGFNHTSAVFLLDSDGRLLAKTERIGGPPDPEFLAKVRAVLK